MLLGLVWAALLVASAEAGVAAMLVLVMPVALVAALSGVRAVTGEGASSGDPASSGDGASTGVGASTGDPASSGDGASSGDRPAWLVVPPRVAIALAPAVLLPLAALAGPEVAVGMGVVLAAGAVALLVVTTGRRFPIAVLAAAFAPAIAAASVVAARGQGLSEGLTLVIAICLYDMASFVTGTGPRGGPAGVIVGMITVGVLAVFVAAVLVPPYSGRNPWILLGLVAVLAPAGVFACSYIGRGRPLPALRRLDSLVLAGPAWVIAVSLLLHR